MMLALRPDFPFSNVFGAFLEEYASCTTYWYVPKSRSLNDENIRAIASILEVVLDGYLDKVWNQQTQDALLSDLVERGLVAPYEERAEMQDRTALPRILKKLLDVLGLLWVQDGSEVVITDAGLELLTTQDQRQVIEQQIAKIQYPNPSIAGRYRDDFVGILPYLFLLQILCQLEYRLSVDEYNLFVNLAKG
jgi:hypothetical protein